MVPSDPSPDPSLHPRSDDGVLSPALTIASRIYGVIDFVVL